MIVKAGTGDSAVACRGLAGASSPATTIGRTRPHQTIARWAESARYRNTPSVSRSVHGIACRRRAMKAMNSASDPNTAQPAMPSIDVGSHSVIVVRMMGLVERSTT